MNCILDCTLHTSYQNIRCCTQQWEFHFTCRLVRCVHSNATERAQRPSEGRMKQLRALSCALEIVVYYLAQCRIVLIRTPPQQQSAATGLQTSTPMMIRPGCGTCVSSTHLCSHLACRQAMLRRAGQDGRCLRAMLRRAGQEGIAQLICACICLAGKPYKEDQDKMWRFTRTRSYGAAFVDEQV
eukprot:1149345-Pelagomonas_calceolata.AAC.3